MEGTAAAANAGHGASLPEAFSTRGRMGRQLWAQRGRRHNAIRMEMVEPVFEQSKQGWEFRQFLLRSLGDGNAPQIASRPVGKPRTGSQTLTILERRVFMTSDQKEPWDADRFHFAFHNGNADDCPECQSSTVQGARHAPLKELEELAIRAALLAPFVPSDGDYKENLPRLIEAAVAYGKAISEWRLIWEYGTHECPGIKCHLCEWRLEPQPWDPVKFECTLHPNCTVHAIQPCWSRKTWTDILHYVALHGDQPLPAHLIARHERKPFNQDIE